MGQKRPKRILRKINDLHPHIRVLYVCDRVGLDLDVIFQVLDEYKVRLSGFPKLPEFSWENTRVVRRYPTEQTIRDLEKNLSERRFSRLGGWFQVEKSEIPYGFKGTIWENIRFMERLDHTQQRGTTNHWCLDLEMDRNPRDRSVIVTGLRNRDFINYKKMDKEL